MSEDILWSLLENEKYRGATLTRSPERVVTRGLFSDMYETERVPREEVPMPIPISSPRPRQTRFAVPPSPAYSPAYSLPEVHHSPPPAPTPRELSEATQREQFSRALSDLETDFVTGGGGDKTGCQR